MKIKEKKIKKNQLNDQRILRKIEGSINGATVVFFAGIHGNEKAGVIALENVFANLNQENCKGTIVAVKGNLKALSQNTRYINQDLNRIFTEQNFEKVSQNTNLNAEQNELKELYNLIKDITKNHQPPFYFIDLHTTSSKTLPFITINDAIINRKFSKLFPVPIILGIEEYIDGALLSYINQLGYVSIGFESGEHFDKLAITNAEAFINLTLTFTGNFLNKNDDNFNSYYHQLKQQSQNNREIFEVKYLYKIKENESFKMIDGFESFQEISKKDILALSDGKVIQSKYKGRIFMPLYQQKGNDGFFIIKKINPFFLSLSLILRKFKFDNLLVLLPGVSWIEKEKGILKVNLKTARFLAKSIFHLLGYRSKNLTQHFLKLTNRERVSKTEMYRNEAWFHYKN